VLKYFANGDENALWGSAFVGYVVEVDGVEVRRLQLRIGGEKRRCCIPLKLFRSFLGSFAS
jgi:hypothetical protein